MSITKPKTILDTETIPRVALDFMNVTHFEEIKMVKEIGKLVSTYQNKEKPIEEDKENLSKALQAWVDHTLAHFLRENKLMQETGFPAFAIHSEEHERALGEMIFVVDAWLKKTEIKTVSDYVFNLWPAWFNGHVNTMDMMTAQFAVMNGYSEN